MTYVAVNELKRGKEIWRRLERDRELVVTRDGQPRALLVHISPETAEESLAEVRRALFNAAVQRARRRSSRQHPPASLVEEVIREARQTRKR